MSEELTPEQRQALTKTILRIHEQGWGIAFGLVSGLGLFVATNWLALKGGEHVGPHLALLGLDFPGYRVSRGRQLHRVCLRVRARVRRRPRDRGRLQPADREDALTRTMHAAPRSQAAPKIFTFEDDERMRELERVSVKRRDARHRRPAPRPAAAAADRPDARHRLRIRSDDGVVHGAVSGLARRRAGRRRRGRRRRARAGLAVRAARVALNLPVQSESVDRP